MAGTVRIIRDSGGRPAFAVIPYDDYERFLDAADEAAAGRAYDAYKATRPETFPDSVAERLIDGENSIKVFREYRGLTQKRLAAEAGINAVYVSQIEAGRYPSLSAVLQHGPEMLRSDGR